MSIHSNNGILYREKKIKGKSTCTCPNKVRPVPKIREMKKQHAAICTVHSSLAKKEKGKDEEKYRKGRRRKKRKGNT